MKRRFEKYYKWIAAFVFCVAVIAVYKTFDNFSNILNGIGVVLQAFSPFIVGFVIAYLLNIPAKKIEVLLYKVKNKYVKKHIHGLSVLTVYLAAVLAVALVLGALIPALYRNVLDLYNNLQTYVSTIENTLNDFEIVKKFNLFGDDGFDLYSKIRGMFESIDMAQFSKYAQGVFNMTSGVLKLFIAIIASVYMLLDKKKLKAGIIRLIKLVWSESTVNSITLHARRINNIFTNYLYSRLICSIVMAVVCGAVLSLMKVKYALILGLFIGLMDMIPYFGSIIATVFSVLITFITGGVWKALWSAVVLLVLQQLDGNILGPKIMGSSLEISPLIIILAVSVGGTLFGFLG
ncbi:MAG: AI-2E family transporter, partial [Oscillospiraceae bacterium]|nr:AI-2E family transporter [Oscillospiraceae bacterium]